MLKISFDFAQDDVSRHLLYEAKISTLNTTGATFMRIILAFFIGFLSCFYISEIIKRVVGEVRYSIFGIIFIVLGFLIGIFGGTFFPGGVNVLASFLLIGSGLGITTHHLLSRRFILFEKVERDFVIKHETRFERFLEILPGSLTWIALTSPIWLSFTLPYAIAYLILIADLY